MRCKGMQETLIEYLDGRANPTERRAVEQHLSSCADCRIRAEEFRALFGVLDDLSIVAPSCAFDASLRARIAAEPARREFWSWLPSPRVAFAVSALVVMSVWLSSMPVPRFFSDQPAMEMPAMTVQTSADSEFRMIRDLPVLENYDVLSKFDALTELPVQSSVEREEGGQETR